MKRILFLLVLVVPVFGQEPSVDDIVNTYFENTGGVAAWSKLNGIKMTGEFNQGGMKLPFEVVQMKDGKTYTKLSAQGKELRQNVFDGETMWSTNFMTMKPEKADAEATANQKLDSNDFPEALFDYKKKKYTAELLGKEDFEGTQCYKVKLVQEPITVDGAQVENISISYFDVETGVRLAQESEVHQGPAKGQTQQVKFSDFQEVDGLYFPFSLTQGLKGGPSGTITITKIELNPDVTSADFAMPAVEPEPAPAAQESQQGGN
ncbi:MAG: outer membrane lipoprotein-sorting protein [Acidobacteria bacterium]|nr:outer membrane lipoprotein-sorting protein [Acidobacteriota bacterium]MCB9396796.1 outer membrane lipoprotein-sorting protein [Acidobacteriota bacterium]